MKKNPQKQRITCRCAKSIYIIINQRIELKKQIRRVRANVCPHSAITLALTAASTMNKGIERKYEGMRAKMKKNFYGRIAKAEFNLFL